MHILFVNYLSFTGASGVHIFFLANEMVKMGHSCTVAVPSNPDSVAHFGTPLFEVTTFDALRAMQKDDAPVPFDVVHGWTPREPVRRFVSLIAKRFKIPYFVHLEDNEEIILEGNTGLSFDELTLLPERETRKLPNWLIHPRHYKTFLQQANGVTCLMDTLADFVPDGVPTTTFWPACEEEFFSLGSSTDSPLRQLLGIQDDEIVLVYTGGLHKLNVGEVCTLYRTVGVLNQTGVSVKLIRAGITSLALPEDVQSIREHYCYELGVVPASHLKHLIEAADILVQPGKADPFNDYRFPSKLPMFMASGRPIVLPLSNIGRHIEHGKNGFLLKEGTVEELGVAIKILMDDKLLRRAMGAEARNFARAHFSWEKSARAVLEFYSAAL